MLYLTAQIWLHLALAFGLGGGVVWWYLRRPGEELSAPMDTVPDELQRAREKLRLKTNELAHRQSEWATTSAKQQAEIESLRGQIRRRVKSVPGSLHLEPRLPEQLVLAGGGGEGRPRAQDDLTRIKGVGNVLAGLLNELGIYTYGEIASWTGDDIERVQASIPQFSGRIRRDDWVSQAAELDQASRV